MKKSKSITILTVLGVFVLLGAIFACVSFPIGNYDYHAFPTVIKQGLDLKGGVTAVYEAERPEGVTDEDFKNSVEGTASSLRELLFNKGFPEAVVSVANTEIRVEVPDVEDPEEVFALIGRPASLQFFETDAEGKKLNEDVIIDGNKHLKSATVGMNENGQYIVSLEFNKEGTKRFADATQRLNGKTIGIFINGVLKINPKVNAVISDGKASLEGGYTYETANETAISIQAGAFSVKMKLVESDTISPILGTNALKVGVISGIVGLLMIFIFMSIVYKGLGLASCISLAIYMLVTLFFMSVFPWVQLTLPGIAGILLSMGMAVDANVIIFERVKEEYKSGKSIATSIDIGFSRALSAIIDGNITTIIGAIVMWIIGAPSIKGFAITLLIGIIISLFTSLFVTRLIIKCFVSINNHNNKFYGLKLGEGEQEQVPAPEVVAIQGGTDNE
ncbi:MAG: protein translocase subunit SecD [Clostridia bacterium]